jgi:hypothetical protein
MPMNDLISRRDALKGIALGAGTILVMGSRGSQAAEAYASLPHVTPSDPVAVALSYKENAKTVDASKFPNYKPGQQCANCLQLGGKEGDAWRPCNLFPGKLVNAGGWCKVYVKKP